MAAATVTEAVLTQVARDSHANAQTKGFWQELDWFPATMNTKLMLIVSEATEAMNVLREKYDDTPVDPFTNMTDQQGMDFIEELADIVIRTFDVAAYFEGALPDIGTVIFQKMEKNRKRPQMHSKAF